MKRCLVRTKDAMLVRKLVALNHTGTVDFSNGEIHKRMLQSLEGSVSFERRGGVLRVRRKDDVNIVAYLVRGD